MNFKSIIPLSLILSSSIAMASNPYQTTQNINNSVTLNIMASTGQQWCATHTATFGKTLCMPVEDSLKHGLKVTFHTYEYGDNPPSVHEDNVYALLSDILAHNSMNVTITNSTGKVIYDNKPIYEKEGLTCTDTSCTPWK